MVAGQKELKKLSEAPEDLTPSTSDDSREAESKSNSHPVANYGRRRAHSFHSKSNFGRIGYRKPNICKSPSITKLRKPSRRRAQTLVNLSNVYDLPVSPPGGVSNPADAVAELRNTIRGLSEQFGEMELRFDKQLGAFHSRFEKLEKMQLTILANIRRFANIDVSSVTEQQEATCSKLRHHSISKHI